MNDAQLWSTEPGRQNGSGERQGPPAWLGRPRAAMDPGSGPHNTRVTEDGETSYAASSLADWIVGHPGWFLVVESTFDLYLLEQRNLIIALAEANDVSLRTVSPRMTYRRRVEEAERQGIKPEELKTDHWDALFIWRTAFEMNTHLKKPTPYEEPTGEMLVRKYRLGRRQRAMRTSDYSNDDAQFWRAALSSLVYRNTRMYALAIHEGKMVSYFVLSLALVAADCHKHGEDVRAFDHACGLYGDGFPGLIRSNAYHHRVRALVDHGRSRKDAMRDCRWAARRIFHEVGHVLGSGRQEVSGDRQDTSVDPITPGPWEQDSML